MSTFYEEMLRQKHLSVFFKTDEAITHLIDIQKQNFIDSVNESPSEIKTRFNALGRMHYDLRVPSADFLKSTSIWRSNFIDCAVLKIRDLYLIDRIDYYFKQVDMAMCEGYLNRQIEVDERDLSTLVRQYKEHMREESDAAVEHLNWLYSILSAIKTRELPEGFNLSMEGCTVHDFLVNPSAEVIEHFSLEHFDDLHQRLHIDAESLFYFIQRGDFPEALSLYASLLSAYKITLIALGNFNLQQRLINVELQLKEKEDEIKELQGIITICSYCHKIRNDKGDWERLEKYISDHSEALFSHGICHNCMDKARSE